MSSLGFGWNFGGVAMLAMGLIAILHFTERARGEKVSRTPVRVIACAYVAFGSVAILVTGDLFFLVFVVPGVLLAAASSRR